ncbi:MAG: cyclase family protein [Rhodospirillales bacterium]|nr:cyclase family protein [Rhodospirillales bacterium]
MKIIDLSVPINDRMIGIPDLPEYEDNPTRCIVQSAVSEKQLERIKSQGLDVVDDPEIGISMVSRLEILGHIGTHVDAPIHFMEDGWSIDQVPLENIIKKGRIIPLTDTEPNAMVTADMVLATGVDFDAGVIPVLHTGWTDRAWGTQRFWDDMICLDTSVSELMIERGVSAVAIDFFPEAAFWNMDGFPPGGPGPNHKLLLGNEIIIIQMLTNIGAIGDKDFTLAAVPLRLENLDGSPARVFAMLD